MALVLSLFEHDVDVVLGSAAGEHRVQQLSVLGARDDAVHDIGRAALGGMNGGGVAQLRMGGDVFRRQPDPKVRLEVSDVEAAVPCDAGESPAVAVLDPVGVAGAEATVVVASQDGVAGGGSISVGQLNHAARAVRLGGAIPPAEADRACGVVESGDELAGGSEHQALAAGRLLGSPGVEDLVEAGVGISAVHAVVVEVEPECCSVTGPQVEGCGGFDRVAEANDLLEAYGAVRAGDVTQDSTGTHGSQLPVVPDEPDPRAAVAAGGDHPVERGCVGHTGLVDNHDGVSADPRILTCGEKVIEHGERLGRHSGRLAEDRGGRRGRCEADGRVPELVVDAGERAHGDGLAGSGRGESQGHLSGVTRHGVDQPALARVELEAVERDLHERELHLERVDSGCA